MKARSTLIKLKRFQVNEKRRQVTQIEMMIAEFERMAAELEEQIASEQKRVGITDITHFAYPTFAKAAMQRRDNLRESVNDLRLQLEEAQGLLAEAVEEMKKLELIEERDQLRENASMEAADQERMDEIAGRMHYRMA